MNTHSPFHKLPLAIRAAIFTTLFGICGYSAHAQCGNVAPYQPSGWDNKLVLSTVTGTTASSATFNNGQAIYVDWAAANFGTCNITTAFSIKIYVDAVLKANYSIASLNSNTYVYINDLNIGALAAGQHTIKIVTDADANVAESNEGDNEYSRTISVTGGATCANLAPYKPSGWDSSLVLSTVSGTNTSATAFNNTQSIYLDWAAINNGVCDITSAFSTSVYVDGVLKITYSTANLPSGYYTSVQDLLIGSLTPGQHTFKVVLDANANVAETNEADNEFTRTITVKEKICANLVPYQPLGWDDKLVLSKVTGTHTSASSFTSSQVIYLDWAVANIGTCNTNLTFSTKLYVDGALLKTYSTNGLNGSQYASVNDLAVGPLADGQHTFKIVVDANKNVSETNETDNEYTRTINGAVTVCTGAYAGLLCFAVVAVFIRIIIPLGYSVGAYRQQPWLFQ